MCITPPPTFLELHVEFASFALQVGAAAGRVGADAALQAGRGGRRGPGHQVVGQGGVAPAGFWRAPRDGRRASAEPRRDDFISINQRTNPVVLLVVVFPPAVLRRCLT